MDITLCDSSFIMTDVHLWGEKFHGVEMVPTFVGGNACAQAHWVENRYK